VRIGFKYPQKVVFVSLKKQQIVDYLRRYRLFSNFEKVYSDEDTYENTYSLKIWRASVYSERKKYFLRLVSGFDVLKPMKPKKYSNHS